MSMKQSQLAGFNDNGPCNSKNTLENLTSCDLCKKELTVFYSYLTTDMVNMSQNLKTYLDSHKNEDSKW